MACNQTTKPKRRKRKLLPSDYTEFGEPFSAKIQQRESTDKLDFTGISDTEQKLLEEFSDVNGQKNRTKLLDVPIFHGDLLPLSQAGKFIPNFQTKLNRKSKTNDNIPTEDVRKKRPISSDECIENKCPNEVENLDCNFQQALEIHFVKDSKNSTDYSESGNLLLNKESKQASEDTGQTFTGVEIAAPLVKILNLSTNDGHDELDVATSQQLLKKSRKGSLQRKPTKTLGIKQMKTTSVSHKNKAEKHLANKSCSTNGIEQENMTTDNSLENEVADEKSKLETSVDGESQNNSFKNSEKNNFYPDKRTSNVTENENLDWISNRVGAFDEKLSAAGTGICVVKIERLKLLEKDSFCAKLTQVDLHTSLDETKNECVTTNSDQNELHVKSVYTSQQHQNLTPVVKLDVNKVNAEVKSKVMNDFQLFLSNSGNMDKESDHYTEERIEGSARSQHASEICPKMSQKTGDQLLVTSATDTKNYDQKAVYSEKILPHSIHTEEIPIQTVDNGKATFQDETNPTRKCTEFDTLLNAELNEQQIQNTEKFNAEAIENFGETEFFAQVGTSPVGKSKEMTIELPSPSDILLQKPIDLGQGNDLNIPAGQSAHQEPCTTFDEFADVTDSQLYLVDEESIKKSTISSFTNVPMLSTGICCPGLANISKAIDIVKYADSRHTNEAKRKEGSKILQNLIKELTTVNAQLIRYRREIEKAKKERKEHLRSTSCARQY